MGQTDTLSLLIADDEALIRRGLSNAIDWEAQHIQVVGEASDGNEAFDMICAIHPDIVITDIKMPDCSGLDLIEKIRAKGYETRFIILSGYDDFAFAQRAIRSKITCYLLKPVKTGDLIAEMARIRDEIIAERTSGALNEQVQFTAQQGSHVMKEQFYAKLAEGELHNENEICRAANLIGLTPISCPCAAVSFRFTLPADVDSGLFSAEDTRLFKFAFRNVLTELAQKGRNIEFFTDRGCELGILISPLDDLNGFLSTFISIMKKVSTVVFSVGIGNTAKTLLDVSASCRAAKEAVEYHMYESGTQFFDFNTLAASQNIIPPQPPNMQKLAEAIILDNVTEIQNELERFFNIIFYIPMPPPRYVRGMCSYLMGDVSKRVAELLQHDSNISIPLWSVGLDSLETFSAIRLFMLQSLTDMAHNIQKYKKVFVPTTIEAAQKYIQSHALSRLLVKSVAEQVHLSESYFTVLFKKVVGITVQDYILNCKLEKAKELLIEKKMSVVEISDRLEYKDYRSFSRAFKRFTGCSPTEYQQNMTSPHERK